MYEYLFFDDYSEGAHPDVLKALVDNNMQQERGYSQDFFSKEAQCLIQQNIKNPTAAVHFVSSGTLANIVSLVSLMKPYESVIAVDTAHPNVYEAGAIEATGHKINIVPGVAGKLTPDLIQMVVESHTDEHMVKPKVVYISQSTEIGTIYSKQELEKLFEVCKQNKLYCYIDGARIGHALMSSQADFCLADIAALCDMFYIGGTKNGALMGEAIVIPNRELQENFRSHLRQRGALLAKARGVSIQFLELFKNNLYFENAKHANNMAYKMAHSIKNLGYEFLIDFPTNQIFPILPNSVIEQLKDKYGFYIWAKKDKHHSVIRLVTSWATLNSAIDDFLTDLKELT